MVLSRMGSAASAEAFGPPCSFGFGARCSTVYPFGSSMMLRPYEVVEVNTGRGRGDEKDFAPGFLPALSTGPRGPDAGRVVIDRDPQAFDPGEHGKALDAPGRQQRPHGRGTELRSKPKRQGALDAFADPEAGGYVLVGRELDRAARHGAERQAVVVRDPDLAGVERER